MNHLMRSLLALSCLIPTLLTAEKLAVSVNAEAAILINADTGAILFEKNAYSQFHPASTTKIATCMYALLKLDGHLDAVIAADQDCIGTVTEEAKRRSNYTLPAYYLIPDASHMGIKKGEEMSLRDLTYGMMIISADDASNIIAKYIGGTIPQFMDELNDYLKGIGCKSTQFYNPHGLHHPKHFSTAYDLAIMTKEAMKNPLFREIVSTVNYTRPKTNKQEATPFVQMNRLLRKGPYYYPKAIGVKTGYYSTAGHNLVSAAKDGDRTLIAVLLKEKERKNIFLDSTKLFEAAFSQPKVQRVLLKKGPQKFAMDLPGASKRIGTYVTEDVALQYYPAEEPKVKCLLYWDKEVKLPVVKDQRVGELVFQLDNGYVMQRAPLYAQEDAKTSWWFAIKRFFNTSQGNVSWIKIGGTLIAFLSLGLFTFQLLRRRG